MADWAVCPHCTLKHSRRPDGYCPRCKQPIDGEAAAADEPSPYQPPASRATPDVYDGRPMRGSLLDQEPADPRLALGARIAGGIFLLNGVLVLIERAMLPSEPGGVFGNPISVVIDFVVGGALLAGSAQVLGLAKFRTIAGGLILPIVHIAQGNVLLAGVQLLFSVSLALLLFGSAAGLRLAAGLTGASLCVGLEVLGLLGSSFLNPARWAMAGQIESEAAAVVQGLKYPYQITAPGGRWHLRKAEAARKDNPLADRWIVRPDVDAHVLVIPEDLPIGAYADMDRFTQVVLTNIRSGGNDVTLVTQEPLSTRVPGRLLHIRGKVNGIQMEAFFGLFAQGRNIFQVMAFAPKGGFPKAKADLRQIIDSFELP